MKETLLDITGLRSRPSRRTARRTVRRRVTTQTMAVVNRMTRLTTTRDGVTWDTTGWTYDSATGLRTAKTYADGSQISYTHTPTGKPLRTTTVRGTWSENIYNEQEQVVATAYSGETPTAYFERNELGYLLAESNTVATTIYKNTMSGVATNEVVTIGAETTTLTRERDACARQTSLAVSGAPVVFFGYNAESEVSSVGCEGWTAHYRFTPDGYDAGVELTTTGGVQLKRLVERDAYRRSLVSSVTNTIDDAVFQFFVYTYDGEGRVTVRNSDAFLYNSRNEVTTATIENKAYLYSYDDIGNFTSNSRDGATTSFSANQLNQYASISPTNGTLSLTYDADGNLTFDGVRTYAWDDANRLTTVSIGGEVILQNEYDTQSRRVRKVTQEATHTFVYDGWNLVKETIASSNGETEVVHYVWGKDLSGTMQGAGGVGGLLAVKRNGVWYHPFYDNNGNITAYVDAQGEVVASYAYDAFGNTITQTGTLASTFNHRFSTKYYDNESRLYYYGYRFYAPSIARWLNRDPIEEGGGVNLYAFCKNKMICVYDILGLNELDDIEKRYRDMIIAARAKNKNVAADNLAHFLDGDGSPKKLDWAWLRGFNSVISAEKENKNRFADSLKKIAKQMRSNEKRVYYDFWDASKTASVMKELYYASGTFTVTSYGKFELSRKGCEVFIVGDVEHYWWDPFDWHAGLGAFVPGFGFISDSDALRLQAAGRAKKFQMNSEWTQSFWGTYTLKKRWFDACSYKWGEAKGGSSVRHSVISKLGDRAVRPPFANHP